MPTAEEEQAPPHVVVMAADRLTENGPERRAALTLAAAGYQVTLLVAGDDGPRRAWLGDVRVVRVPVTGTLRSYLDSSRARRRAWRPGRGHEASSRRPGVVDVALGRVWRTVDGVVARMPLLRGWSAVVPEVDEIELALGPEIDRLAPDVVHTCDVRLAVTACRAVGRSVLHGRTLRWAHHTGSAPAARPRPGVRASRVSAAHRRLERRVVSRADRRVAAGDEPLLDAYSEMLGAQAPPATRATRPSHAVVETSSRPVRRSADMPPVIGIGPANMAGQGWAWAKALERMVPGLRTEVLAVDRGSPLTFRADELVPLDRWTKDAAWGLQTQERALATWTHALLEVGRPLFGYRNGRDFRGDASLLRDAGITVGLLFHGSEVRSPARHREQTPWSPFGDPEDEMTARLQAGCDRLLPLVQQFDGPTFVSTPDLLSHVPRSSWVPVVVDVDAWSTDTPVLERDVPVVVHTPSRAALKGSDHVERAMAPLVGEGLVEYRRLEGVAPEKMVDVLHDADVVLDQFTLGSYGVLAAQAMAAGRVVVGHVTPECRAHCGLDVPVVEAPPDLLEDVLRRIMADRAWAAAQAARGPAYVRRLHDGTAAAQVLAGALGLGR